MSEQVKVTGIILSAAHVGDHDKTLTILTRERGKIQVFSRGSRKVKHPLHAVSQTLISGEFMISETRMYNYLNSGQLLDYFPYIKDSLDKIYYSTYFAELARFFSLEGEDGTDLLNLLYVTFRAMKKAALPLPLIRRIFELKLLELSGLGLWSMSCLKCGKTQQLDLVSFRQGGVLCRDCGTEAEGTLISPDVLAALQYVAQAPLTRLYSFILDQRAAEELAFITNRFFSEHVDHHFRSEAMLDMV